MLALLSNIKNPLNMKRIFALTLIASLILVKACSKKEDLKSDDSITTVFENKNVAAMRSKPFNPILNDYTVKVENVGYNNSSLTGLKAAPEFAGILERFKLNLKDISRHYYDHNYMNTTFIPFTNSLTKEMLIAYNVSDKYYFAIGKEVDLPGGLKHLIYSSLNGNIFYEFKINRNNKIGEFRSQTSPFETGVREGISMSASGFDPLGDLVEDNVAGRGRCSMGFNNCMNCFYKSCGDEWQCGLLCSVAALACNASWAAACITKRGCSYPTVTEEIPAPEEPIKIDKDTTLILTPL
jgi:hypothetical protein